jgi:trans-2,3-dihydro-3-hydroxyanthranilate isomerase
MRTYQFLTLDVFTTTRFGGNPLAVFPEAAGLSDAEMQAIAAEFNLSETTFVLPPENAANTARVRIFTPAREMPFAGHPNVGTGWALAGRAVENVLRFEELAGLVTVTLARDAAGALAAATIAAPLPLTLGPEFAVAEIAPCAGLSPGDIITARHVPICGSVGNPFILAEVTPEALRRAVPDAMAMKRLGAAHPVLNNRAALYIYAHDGGELRSRMFAPSLGVGEDPATGSAATPLAGLLLQLSGADSGSWDMHQGVEMGRPSLLRTTARRTEAGIMTTVGGACVPVMRGEISL